MILEDWKIKISVLWLFWIVVFLAHVIMGLFEPGVIEDINAGEIAGMKMTPEMMLFVAIIILVPLVMAFLSLTLKDLINRWANVALGIFYTGLCLFDWIGSLAQPAHSILMYISEIMASALIVWYAWKSKKQA